MTVTQVCRTYGVTVDTLRYYEKIALIPYAKRDKSGYRDYTETDCNWLVFVLRMRDAGVPVKALRRYMELFHQGVSTHEERRQLLKSELSQMRERLSELQKTYESLKFKVEHYDDHLVPAQEKLTRTGL